MGVCSKEGIEDLAFKLGVAMALSFWWRCRIMITQLTKTWVKLAQ
jgi:hypothetical protein